MRAAERRLARVAQRLGPPKGRDPFEHLTDDELEIWILDLARQIASQPEVYAPEKVAEARERVASIEARIVRAACKQHSPEYQRHLAWLRLMWNEEKRGIPYVCDLLDGSHGYCGWEKPNIMARRQALRERPDTAALISKGAELAKAGLPPQTFRTMSNTPSSPPASLTDGPKETRRRWRASASRML